MKVAVITPYYRTPRDWLVQCHESVRNQSYPCSHILVADGAPESVVNSLDVQHIILPDSHADYGDTPRAIGSISAIGQGFDAIAWLDADNWFALHHIENLVNLHRQTGAAVCTSGRMLQRLDGSTLGRCLQVDGKTFVDTSCYLVTRAAFKLVAVWYLIAPQFHVIDDKIVWQHVKELNLTHAHDGASTVAYRTAYKVHYLQFNETPPPGTRDSSRIDFAERLWRGGA